MQPNATPLAERPHIAFLGLRNAGKSSLVNAIAGQEVSLVSAVAGTTTDPVLKSMELQPIGPVALIDTPGLDDVGTLGLERVRRARNVLEQADLAVLVVDATLGLQAADRELLDELARRALPHVLVYGKIDMPGANVPVAGGDGPPCLGVSAASGAGIHELKEKLAALLAAGREHRPLVRDLLKAGDVVLLVTPLDAAAPVGRLILPQQMTLRDALDAGALPLCARESEYAAALAALAAPPRLVITDSKVFREVDALTPANVSLTSFCVRMARYKGLLEAAIAGAQALDDLHDGDTLLIAEGCTHHRQCDDIGTVRLPRMLMAHTGRALRFAFASGGDFPEDLTPYALVVHCGGCMRNAREMRSRARRAASQGVPMTNYGIAMARMGGILDRCVAPFATFRRDCPGV